MLGKSNLLGKILASAEEASHQKARNLLLICKIWVGLEILTLTLYVMGALSIVKSRGGGGS